MPEVAIALRGTIFDHRASDARLAVAFDQMLGGSLPGGDVI
jgi:hypothetical protein